MGPQKPKDLDAAQKIIDSLEKEKQSLQSQNASLTKEKNTESQTTSQAYSGLDISAESLMDPVSAAGDLWGKIQSTFSGENLLGDITSLADQSQSLANSMGIGSARSQDLRTFIADTVPEMVKLGFSEQEALTAFASVSDKLKVNTTLSTETMADLGAASKLTNSSAGELAEKFKSVGVNLDKVGKNMADVANYARSVGVNVTAVTGKVLENISRLNTMNFEGGIKGLTKMVSQSEMLGVNMEKVLSQADSLMDPEAAIKFSSTLQQLGVQSSALLDPLSAMDMALNDPTALQDEMVKVSQQFTRMKADGSGFEILPGAKLQMKAVAEGLGMTAAEFSNMALKSADLDMKMSKIRFPSLAASEEDRMLLANMSQMKDGRAVVSITDEKTGERKEVDVENLTASQIDKLKEEQTNQNKTAEELAIEQLTVQKQIAANTAAGQGAIRMGAASAAPLQRATNAAMKSVNEITKGFTDQISTQGVRGGVTDILGPIEKEAVNLATGGFSVDKISESLTSLKNELPGAIAKNLALLGNFGIEGLKTGLTGAKYAAGQEYESVTGKPAVRETESQPGGVLDTLNAIQSKASEYVRKLEVAFNIKQEIEIKGNSTGVPNEDIKKEIKDGVTEFMTDQANMGIFDKAYGTYKTSSGMNE
jgi:hypothetical protein